MPEHAITVGADRAGNFLAMPVCVAMISIPDVTPALIATLVAMRLVAIGHGKLRRLRFGFCLQRGERTDRDRYRRQLVK